MNTLVVLAMTSFYHEPSDLRCQLAVETITNGRSVGHMTAVVDGSPNPEITRCLLKAGGLVFAQRNPGMAPSRREVFTRITEALFASRQLPEQSIILWTEEKPFIVEHIPTIIRPILGGRAVAVIAKRSEKNFDTWPTFQAESEKLANAAYNRITGKDSDPMFGPVAVRADYANFFSDCFPERYGVPPFAAGYIQHFGVLELLAAGHPIADSEPLDVIYPPAQREEEEGTLVAEMQEKRVRQMHELSRGYKIAAAKLGIRWA